MPDAIGTKKKLSILYQGTCCFLDKSFYLRIRIVVTNFYGEYWKAINMDTSDTAVCVPFFAVLCHTVVNNAS